MYVKVQRLHNRNEFENFIAEISMQTFPIFMLHKANKKHSGELSDKKNVKKHVNEEKNVHACILDKSSLHSRFGLV